MVTSAEDQLISNWSVSDLFLDWNYSRFKRLKNVINQLVWNLPPKDTLMQGFGTLRETLTWTERGCVFPMNENQEADGGHTWTPRQEVVHVWQAVNHVVSLYLNGHNSNSQQTWWKIYAAVGQFNRLRRRHKLIDVKLMRQPVVLLFEVSSSSVWSKSPSSSMHWSQNAQTCS